MEAYDDGYSEVAVNAKKPQCSARERILEAALKQFSQKGYLGTTTKEVAIRAGFAELTLFRCFTRKARLLEEVISTSAFLPTMQDVLSEALEMSYEDDLVMIAERFLQKLEKRRDLIRIMHWEMHRHARIRRAYDSIVYTLIKTLASYFREMQRRGVLEEFDAENGAVAYLGMLFSYFSVQGFRTRNRHRDTDTAASIKNCLSIFAKGTLVLGSVPIMRNKKRSSFTLQMK